MDAHLSSSLYNINLWLDSSSEDLTAAGFDKRLADWERLNDELQRAESAGIVFQRDPTGALMLAIQYVGPDAVGALATAIGAWLQARHGRKVRLKLGDIEAEARTIEEVEQLIDRARSLQGRQVKPADPKQEHD